MSFVGSFSDDADTAVKLSSSAMPSKKGADALLFDEIFACFFRS